MSSDRAGTSADSSTLKSEAPSAVAAGVRPQRTCVGCRGTAQRSSLLRIVVNAEGTALVLDARKTMPGRGAWLHSDAECLSKATTRRAWGRALKLRAAVDSSALHNVLVEHLSTTSPTGGTPQESHFAASNDHDRKRV